MASFQDNTHVFIVRVWLEPRELAGARAEWRGVIEHMASGEVRYVHDLDDLVATIAPYLADLGVSLPLRWRFRQRIRRWKRYPSAKLL